MIALVAVHGLLTAVHHVTLFRKLPVRQVLVF